MACLFIAALLAAIVIYTARGPVSDAKFEDAIQQLAFSDRLMRDQAVRSGQSLEMRFDFSNHAIQRAEWTEDGEVLRPVDLPHGVEVEAVWLGDKHDVRNVAVRFSSTGRTPSYAVLMKARGQKPRWMLVTGITGATKQYPDDGKIEEIFDLLDSERNDAD